MIVRDIRELNIKCPILRGNRFRQYTARLEFIARMEKALKDWQIQREPKQKLM